MLDRIEQTVDFLNKNNRLDAEIAIILGSGLGVFIDKIEVIQSIPYEEIPHFPISTVEGHSGNFIIGMLEGVPILALQGRFHYYEGYSLRETTYPIRVLKALGINTLLLSNASGGLNPDHEIGDLMIIEDHIHLIADNPLRGKNIDELGPRFPDMSEPYSRKLISLAKQIAQENGLKLHEGVYLGTSGPTYETPSEYRYFRKIGADAVGMSTTAETIVAVHAGLKVFGLSVISDLGVDGKIVEISHEEVQAVAASAAPKLNLIFKEMVKQVSVNADLFTLKADENY